MAEWPWPPPVSLAVLNELTVALRFLRTEVPESQRAAFDAAPIDWCVRNRAQALFVFDRGVADMRGAEFFRRFKPGT